MGLTNVSLQYSLICTKRSPMEQTKSGLLRQVLKDVPLI